MDEAIELAKIYSGEDAPRFINGILGKIAKDLMLNSGSKE
ncbi:MAG: transcription antitermination factor NusB [Thermacetogeniaceae bacterium]